MKDITLEQLLEAGCHFGHQVTRQNPKAREFVFEHRDGIQIIDLTLTKKGLDAAAAYVTSLAATPDATLVIVGSKRQAAPLIIAEVNRVKNALKEKGITDGLFHVTARWIGGTLTNTVEVHKNYKKLTDITALLKDDFNKAKYTKKELGLFEKEKQKLLMYYGGIAEIKTLPSALFVVDTHLENLAVREASRMQVPIVGIVDTNADPDVIDYVIPANDDAVGSLQLIISYILDAWLEGRVESTKIAKTEDEKDTKTTKENEITKNTKGNKEAKTVEKEKVREVTKKRVKKSTAKSEKSEK